MGLLIGLHKEFHTLTIKGPPFIRVVACSPPLPPFTDPTYSSAVHDEQNKTLIKLSEFRLVEKAAKFFEIVVQYCRNHGMSTLTYEK